MQKDTPDIRKRRYLLLSLITTGTMTELYRGRLSGARGFEKPVVLKKLLPQRAKDPAAVADLSDEARLGALLNHENFVQIYDFCETDGGYFIVMEHLAGHNLATIMQRAEASGGMPVGQALSIAAGICAGMEYAHALKDPELGPLNFIHRELCPNNIVVTGDGKVKIIDFGSARMDILEDRTRKGMIKGKVAYMSPEQLAATDIDRRADIFAIGILLYEMLSGRRMYSGEPATLIRKCRNVDYAGLDSVAGRLPPAVRAVVAKALQPDRDQRYQSCGQMLADIEGCLAAIQPRPNSQALGSYLHGLFAEAPREKRKWPVRQAAAAGEEDGKSGLPGPVVAANRRLGKSSGRPGLGRAARFFAGCSGILLAVLLLPSNMPEENMPGAEPATSLQAGLGAAPQAVADSAATPTSPATPAVAPDDGRAKKIEALLAQAEEAWEENRLTEPEDDCAYWVYSKILAIDPKNAEAWQGIQRINTYYGDEAEKAVSEYKFHKAEQLVARGLQVFPGNRRLEGLQEGMGEQKQQYIRNLAGRAERALRRDDLTTPVEDCAYTHYKKILKLDTHNHEALKGIEKIADRYAELAEDAYRNLQLANCREFVKKGLAVTPHHPKLLELREDLSRSMPGIFFKSVEKSISTMFD